MTKTIRARYQEGRLELLEPLELADGSEVTITIDLPATVPPSGSDPTLATAGAFKDSPEWAEFEKTIQERRLSE